MSLLAEIVATCSALGYLDTENDKYYKDSNTLETVKDLIRYLRKDDENHTIRKQLGETKVLQTDLLPLLKNYWEEEELFDALLRLLVNLTSPTILLWHNELPQDKSLHNFYLQVEEQLRGYKQAFADDAIWAIFSTKISKILQIDSSERGDENSLIIERILILVRNIFYVPSDAELESGVDNDTNVHDQVLWALHKSGMLDIILYICCSPSEQPYCLHLLEILYFMFKEQSAAKLAQTDIPKTSTSASPIQQFDVNKAHTQKYNNARHSRFGGTYVIQATKSISDNDLICHKPLKQLEAVNFDKDKKKIKVSRRFKPLEDAFSEHHSLSSIRLFLKEFCVEFLHGGYNTIMYQAKENLVRAKAQANDESYYLWAVRFFMEFNRSSKFEMKLVSETMSTQSFHFIQQEMEKYHDILKMERKKVKLWFRRAHLGLLAYRELLLTLCAMDKSADASVRKSAVVIKSNIFYILEYREFVLTLLHAYNPVKTSLAYLNDLIEMQHIFMKLLQQYCSEDSGIVVQKQVRKKRTKKVAVEIPPSPPLINLQELWDEAAPQVSVVLEGRAELLNEVVPIDLVADIPESAQKLNAMKNVQNFLRNKEFENAIGLLRAARDIWPENDYFGEYTILPEDEFLLLKDVFFASLEEHVNAIAVTKEPPSQVIEDEEEEEEEEDESSNALVETDFKFEDILKRLTHWRIVHLCCIALENFDKNSIFTNHCIAKLLHRIVWDGKKHVLMFQASVFRIFQRILAVDNKPEYKELVKLAKYVLGQFFRVAASNPKIFMEVLFWTTNDKAYEIEYGYSNNDENSAAAAKAWTENDEDELQRLFSEYQESQTDTDMIDWIVNNLINKVRTRRAVMKKLRELQLVTDVKQFRKKGNSNAQWTENDEVELRQLYAEFCDDSDMLKKITNELSTKRTRNKIIEKMLDMNLITNKEQVLKKTAKRKPRQQAEQHNDSHSEDESSDEDDNVVTKFVIPSFDEIEQATSKVVELGLIGALNWICENLNEIVEEIHEYENNDQGVPLVPITEDTTSAMEDENFQTFLKLLGIRSPSNEQEIYWRIPTNIIKLDLLKTYCRVIKDALENNSGKPGASTQTDQNQESSNNMNVEISDGPKRKRNLILDSDSEDNSDDEEVQTKLPEVTQSQEQSNNTNVEISDEPKRKRNLILDSDSEDNFDEDEVQTKLPEVAVQLNDAQSQELSNNKNFDSEGIMNVETSDVPSSKRKRKRLVINTDSEDTSDENDATTELNKEFNSELVEQVIISNTSAKQKRKRVILESDSDSDEAVTTQSTEDCSGSAKGKLVFDSDSD